MCTNLNEMTLTLRILHITSVKIAYYFCFCWKYSIESGDRKDPIYRHELPPTRLYPKVFRASRYPASYMGNRDFVLNSSDAE